MLNMDKLYPWSNKVEASLSLTLVVISSCESGARSEVENEVVMKVCARLDVGGWGGTTGSPPEAAEMPPG